MVLTLIAITTMAVMGFIPFAGTTILPLALGLIGAKIFGLTNVSLALIGTVCISASFVSGILGSYIFYQGVPCQPLAISVSKFIKERETQKLSLKNPEKDPEEGQAPARSPSTSSLASN